MRMFGGVIWFIIPVVALMLFLPHDVSINYDLSILLLFGILLVNFATMLLPFREALFDKYFNVIMSLYSAALIALVCAAIYYTGGMHSPFFTLLMLVTAFCASLFSSLSSAIVIAAVSSTAYLSTVLIFSRVTTRDVQFLASQTFFLILAAFFVNRLGSESRERAQEKAKAMEELRMLSEMDRATSSFVSAVSFEMRTPLTSILGFSDMLVNGGLPEEKERQYVEIISREAENLSRLVEDLLDISRLESGKVRLSREVTQLDHLVSMSIHMLKPLYDPDQIMQSIPKDLPRVMVDAKRMKRVFDAVFAYLVRKSGPGSEIRASAKAEGEEVVLTFNIRNREEAVVRGQDGGRIFPAPGASQDEDLELAMARRIVIAHSGSLNLIQASGGWSAIVIRLPEIVARDFIVSAGPQPVSALGQNPA
jgi:signal transduction histidine kinase